MNQAALGLALLLISASAVSAQADLRVTPEGAVIGGRPIAVVVEGLEPGSEAVLKARTPYGSGHALAWGRFRADAAGRIDAARDAPLEGTYEGVDPRGLFWSGREEGFDAVAAGLARGMPPLDGGEFMLAVQAGDQTLDRERIAILSRDLAIQPIYVSQGPIVGWFAAPENARGLPAIVTLGGSEGGIGAAKAMALRLAAEGYAVLALGYYSGSWQPIDGLPTAMESIRVELIEEARDWLAQRPEADVSRFAVAGGSKGAEFALVAASTFDWIDAVVALTPSDLVWQGFATAGVAGSSWSYRGQDLPFIAYTRWPSEPVPVTPVHVESEAAAGEARRESARIPIERAHAALFLVAGEEDSTWHSAVMTRRLTERLRAANYPYPVEALIYPDTGHSVGWTGYRNTTQLIEQGGYGGTPQGNARSHGDSFPRMLAFLKRSLAPAAPNPR